MDFKAPSLQKRASARDRSAASFIGVPWNLEWYFFGATICISTKYRELVDHLIKLSQDDIDQFRRVVTGNTQSGDLTLVERIRDLVNETATPFPWPDPLPPMPNFEFGRQDLFILGPQRFVIPWPIPAASPSEEAQLEYALEGAKLDETSMSDADYEINIDDIFDACHYYVKEGGRTAMEGKRSYPLRVRRLIRTRATVPDHTTISIDCPSSAPCRPTDDTRVIYQPSVSPGLHIQLGWALTEEEEGARFADWPCGALQA